jgi:hypothetical protein
MADFLQLSLADPVEPEHSDPIPFDPNRWRTDQDYRREIQEQLVSWVWILADHATPTEKWENPNV